MGLVIPPSIEELLYILEHRDSKSMSQIARDLGRSYEFVHRHAHSTADGWKSSFFLDEAGKEKIRQLVPTAICNSCIGREVGIGRKEVRRWRKQLGLSAYQGNGMQGCQRCSDRTRETTKQQLAKAGLKSIGMLRVVAFRKYARENGWPEDLRPRAVQILSTLYLHGPQTRRQIAERIGMPWKGSRASLHNNDKEGSYLANLMARGLVVCANRKLQQGGQGKNVGIYMIPLHIQPEFKSDGTTKNAHRNGNDSQSDPVMAAKNDRGSVRRNLRVGHNGHRQETSRASKGRRFAGGEVRVRRVREHQETRRPRTANHPQQAAG